MVGQWSGNLTNSKMVTKRNNSDINKIAELCTDRKYLSMKTLIVQKPAKLPDFYVIRVKGISEKDLSMDLLLNRYQE